MINAQPTPYSPAANFLLYVPGITTLLDGTRPLYSTGSAPLTSIILVDLVSTTFAPSTASFSTSTPSTTIQRLPTKHPSSIITGLACNGSSTPPIPTPPLKCTPLPICAQLPTVAQVSTMLPSST